MGEIRTIKTERLLLGPFTLADAKNVQMLAGDKDVASTTASIPHPYEDGVAEKWIAMHQHQFDQGICLTLAITQLDTGMLMGAISLRLEQDHERAELGYWLGKPYWNKGYTTEAVSALLRYGFEVLGLNRIYARHMTRNPASGRVLQKVGMTHEGHLIQHEKKWGVFEDLELYGILRNDFAF